MLNELPKFRGLRKGDARNDSAPEPLAPSHEPYVPLRSNARGKPIGKSLAGTVTRTRRARGKPNAPGLKHSDALLERAGGDPLRVQDRDLRAHLGGSVLVADQIGEDLTGSGTLCRDVLIDPIAPGHGTGANLSCDSGGDPIGEDLLGREALSPAVLTDPILDGGLPLCGTLVSSALVEELCTEVRDIHRRAAFMTKQRIGMQNRTLAFVRVHYLGWNLSLDEKTRAKLTAEAARMVKLARDGKGDPALALLVTAADAASNPCETYETGALKQLAKAVTKLPGAAFVAGVRGFGAVSFGRLIGETGALHLYSNPAKVWKRLGLAVIEGQSQRRHSNVELAAMHGYNPARRSVSWIVFESVFKAQLRKVKEGDDEGSTVAIGPYGQVYLDAKKRYTARAETEEWPANRRKLRIHRSASRYAEKLMIKHLWRAWRRDMKIADDA